jgi:hypothetical protein
MKHENDRPEGVVYFNLSGSKGKTLPEANTIKTIISNDIFTELRKNDENPEPLFVVEAIDFPVEGSGGIYTKQFFESFLSRMKNHVYGGNKLGHSYPERNDFYTIGGQLELNEDGESGTVYLKIYIPSFGFETTNSGFIRDVKAKNVHYSLVTAPTYEMKADKKGNMIRYFIGSTGYERNDAVPYEAGAMKQRVNSIGADIEEIKKAIENGRVDRKEDRDGSIMQNGVVYRSSLRRAISRANETERPELAGLLSMIDKTQNGGKPMDLNEAMSMVGNAIKNGAVAVADIAKECKFEKLLRNEADEQNAVMVNSLTAKLGEKPMDKIDAMIAENKANASAIARNSVADAFGAAEKEVEGKKIVNSAFTYAMKTCEGKTGVELNSAIEELKKDDVMKTIRANQADIFSGVNVIKNSGDTGATKPRVIEA